jgi:hypothetical protein
MTHKRKIKMTDPDPKVHNWNLQQYPMFRGFYRKKVKNDNA